VALPEIVTHQDRLLTIDTNENPPLKGLLHPGIRVHPLMLDAYNGLWVLRAIFPPGVTLPMHFHTGTVHMYTMSGCWYYTEHPEQKQTAGCYLYEPGGSIHQLETPASNTEDTDTFMVVTGSNINFLDDGSFLDIMDAGMIKAWVDRAIKDQGLSNMKYIATTCPTYSMNPHPRVRIQVERKRR
jgi:hypothetical protein